MNSDIVALASRVYTLSKRNCIGDFLGVAFDDIPVPFQYYRLLDLRNAGFLVLDVSPDRRPGVSISKLYQGLTRTEFLKKVKNYFKNDNYEKSNSC